MVAIMAAALVVSRRAGGERGGSRAASQRPALKDLTDPLLFLFFGPRAGEKMVLRVWFGQVISGGGLAGFPFFFSGSLVSLLSNWKFLQTRGGVAISIFSDQKAQLDPVKPCETNLLLDLSVQMPPCPFNPCCSPPWEVLHQGTFFLFAGSAFPCGQTRAADSETGAGPREKRDVGTR